MTHAETMRPVRQAIREVYTWPGGYEMFLVLDDGESLCMTCAREHYREVSTSTRWASRDGWGFIAIDATRNTDSEVSCAHCNKQLSAYYEQDSEPSEDDWQITPCGYLGSRYSAGTESEHLGEYGSLDDAHAAIRAKGNADKFWPSIWHVSDHGNAELITFNWEETGNA